MRFVEIIEQAILEEAEKLANRQQQYHNNLAITHARDQRRLTSPPRKVVLKPDYWERDKKFNPFYVLKHSPAIARSIALKLQAGQYRPNQPFVRRIPKPSGGFREVMVYQVPDAAVSNLYYRRLLKKNGHRFSSFCYAYRRDRNVQFAIQDISVDLKYYSLLFIAEFDFSNFFGSVQHEYLYSQFDQNGFLISESERQVMSSFVDLNAVGMPQGTSISLFLANLVCWRLDKQLEALGVKFARYADDTIIWSNDYPKICRSFEIIEEFSKTAGVSVNVKKSAGISLLTREGMSSEFGQSKHSFDFLGYQLSVNKVSIGRRAVRKIKKQISYLIYKNLIQPLKGPQLRGLVIPSNNQDEALLVAMCQVRRYLYGNLGEDYLRQYLSGARDRIVFRGVMSFYPLVDDESQLRDLDRWLVQVTYRAIKLRARLLTRWGQDRSGQFPFNVRAADLVERLSAITIRGKRLLAIPSFFRMYRALRRGLASGGIEATTNQRANQYDYEQDL
jgi:RNA-directed DNA polymerase